MCPGGAPGAGLHCRMPDVTIYHNARCSNSRGALALLRERGIEPAIVDYIAQPLDCGQLAALVADLLEEMDTLRALARQAAPGRSR